MSHPRRLKEERITSKKTEIRPYLSFTLLLLKITQTQLTIIRITERFPASKC
jgi:hypothetical protein